MGENGMKHLKLVFLPDTVYTLATNGKESSSYGAWKSLFMLTYLKRPAMFTKNLVNHTLQRDASCTIKRSVFLVRLFMNI
jgi:acyl dehydratase